MWVVLVGRLCRLAVVTSPAVTRLAINPWPAVIAVTFWPGVSTTRVASSVAPNVIATATTRVAASGPKPRCDEQQCRHLRRVIPAPGEARRHGTHEMQPVAGAGAVARGQSHRAQQQQVGYAAEYCGDSRAEHERVDETIGECGEPHARPAAGQTGAQQGID